VLGANSKQNHVLILRFKSWLVLINVGKSTSHT